MGCDDVPRVVYFYLDGTLAAKQRGDFADHLSLCPECEARMQFHRRLREFIRRRLTPVEAPNHLKIRLSRSLRAFSAEWSA